MRIMKSSAMKTIVVQLTADNVDEFDIDTDIFEDPFMEAATRAVEKALCRHSCDLAHDGVGKGWPLSHRSEADEWHGATTASLLPDVMTDKVRDHGVQHFRKPQLLPRETGACAVIPLPSRDWPVQQRLGNKQWKYMRGPLSSGPSCFKSQMLDRCWIF